MFVVKPMPKEILIHEVVYEEYEEKGRHGNSFKEPVTLKHVLIQPISSINRTSNVDNLAYNSLMFFDCVNSAPADVTFTKKSRITFNEETMIVDKVNPIYTFSLHHYELELI